MGLFQRAVETFDSHADFVGDYSKGNPIAPIGHITTAADIVINLTEAGEFLSAKPRDKSDPKVIIPVTEASVGRTSSPAAHPLCDQICYLAEYDEAKHQLYVDGLKNWYESVYSHPFLKPVLTYIQAGTIIPDLLREQVIKLDKDGKPDGEKKLVCWHISGSDLGDSWTNKSLFKAFTEYYLKQRQGDHKEFCMVSGKMTILAKQHIKGLVSINGNAKLISANDKSGFTYRGRFENDTQALTVGYEASQKAHNALRWLIENQSVMTMYGGRAFLCWNPQGKKIPHPANAFGLSSEDSFTPSTYKEALKHAINSYKKENLIFGTEPVVTTAFDAATPGRLAVAYYSEMTANDFLARLVKWDATCCWYRWKDGNYCAYSPSLSTLVRNAFGTERTEKGQTGMVVDEKIYKQHMQRLLACKLGDQILPMDLVRSLTQRASMPQAYEKNVWLGIMLSACAAIKKYRYDQLEEEWAMALEEQNTNRSYLFGRLLAIADKVEQDTYDRDEGRMTNASKMQSVFSRKPLYAWRIIEESLTPYYQRLSPGSRSYYKRIIGSIVEKLNTEASDLDKPLEDVYLLGYYNQRQALYKKKENENNNEQ